jgi:hypothetical protein
MKLIKRLIEVAFVMFLLSLFMMNKDVEMQITYFWLSQPIKLAFWELVTLCVSLGIIIAAVGDFITQLKWARQRRRMIKTDKEHSGEVARLRDLAKGLESENERLKKELEQKTSEVSFVESQQPALSQSRPTGPSPES